MANRKKEENGLLSYHNNLAKLSLKELTAGEINIFHALCYECQNRGDEEIELSFDEIKDLIDFSGKSDKRFINDLQGMSEQINKLSIVKQDEDTITVFTFFPTFKIGIKTKTLTVAVNPEFTYLINQLNSGQYTRLELNRLVNIQSVYGKLCFRQLMRFRDTGWWQVTLSEFRELLDIPETYSVAEIKRRILKPIEKEMSSFLGHFSVEEIRGPGRGRPVVGYKFTFDKMTAPYTDVRYKTIPHGGEEDRVPYETRLTCPKCGQKLWRLKRGSDGLLFYGHIDGWNSRSVCAETFQTVADIKGYAETPERGHLNFNNENLDEKTKENLEKLKGVYGKMFKKV